MMDWTNLKREAPEWFLDAKFGLFFHWGPYCVPACENEWYSRNMYLKGSKQNLWHTEHYGPVSRFGYKDFLPLFRGEAFDAADWADLAVRAGARYAGPVTEHADNYSLWPSKVNPINAMRYMGRDIIGECSQAFREKGLRFLASFHHQWLWGWFMSSDNEADVYDPKNKVYYGKALPLEANRYQPYCLPDEEFSKVWLEKVREVVAAYRPDVVYFDGRTMIIPERYRHEMADFYYRQNGITDGILTYKQEDLPRGLGVVDVECGRFAELQPFPWQTDDRLEDNITWCIVQEPRYKPAKEIIQQLCDVVAKNGTLLLNVGPRADGTFPKEARHELYRIGDWLRQNGEAIYSTRPFSKGLEGVTIGTNEDYNAERLKQQMKDGIAVESGRYQLKAGDYRFTQNSKAVYLLGFGIPEDRVCRVRMLREGGDMGAIRSVQLLGEPGELEFTRDCEWFTVRLPEGFNSSLPYAIRMEKG